MEVITQNFLYNFGTITKNVANFLYVTKPPIIFGHQISKVDGVLWPKYNVRKQYKDQMKFEYWEWEIEFGKGDAENTVRESKAFYMSNTRFALRTRPDWETPFM